MLTNITRTITIEMTVSAKHKAGFRFSFDYESDEDLKDFLEEGAKYIAKKTQIMPMLPIWENYLERRGIKPRIVFFGKGWFTKSILKLTHWLYNNSYRKLGDYKYRMIEEVGSIE